MTADKDASAPKPDARRAPANRSYPWLQSYPKGIDWHLEVKPAPLTTLLDQSVSRCPDRPCTYFLGKTMAYREIGALVDRIARGLQDLGIGKGSHVGLLLPNSPAYVAFYFGILKTGATVVNYNPLYTPEELEQQVRDSATTIMVTFDLAMLFSKVEQLLAEGPLEKAIVCSFAGQLPAAKAMLFRLAKARQLARPRASRAAARIIPEADLIANDGRYRDPGIDPETDVAVLQYTGGTTGTPKGAMLSHANLAVNVEQVRAWVPGLTEGNERVMGILPFFHVFAMTTVLNIGVAIGGEMVLMPRFELEQALKLIHARRPTVLPGVPTLFNAMLHHHGIERYDLSSLKFCISGGAALPIEVKRSFETLTGCKLVEGYGLSETSPVATCNPVEGEVHTGSIGLPVPATVISIRDIEDRHRELPLGQDGEIYIGGPQVMLGYWNKPEDTSDVLIDGFLRTGDVGHIAEDGFIYIVDRLKDMINCSGFKVYPRRIEDAIYGHPAVAEVTVVGIPDQYRGEAPKAYIKLRPGQTATAAEILKFLEPHISKLEMPAEIEFRDTLPRTMVGKLSKKELRAEAQAATPAPARTSESGD